jgi:hypothetical protein
MELHFLIKNVKVTWDIVQAKSLNLTWEIIISIRDPPGGKWDYGILSYNNFNNRKYSWEQFINSAASREIKEKVLNYYWSDDTLLNKSIKLELIFRIYDYSYALKSTLLQYYHYGHSELNI